jgi:hypothetical protein
MGAGRHRRGADGRTAGDVAVPGEDLVAELLEVAGAAIAATMLGEGEPGRHHGPEAPGPVDEGGAAAAAAPVDPAEHRPDG